MKRLVAFAIAAVVAAAFIVLGGAVVNAGHGGFVVGVLAWWVGSYAYRQMITVEEEESVSKLVETAPWQIGAGDIIVVQEEAFKVIGQVKISGNTPDTPLYEVRTTNPAGILTTFIFWATDRVSVADRSDR